MYKHQRTHTHTSTWKFPPYWFNVPSCSPYVCPTFSLNEGFQCEHFSLPSLLKTLPRFQVDSQLLQQLLVAFRQLTLLALGALSLQPSAGSLLWGAAEMAIHLYMEVEVKG